MTASTIPAVIDALVTLFGNTIGTSNVFDGPAATDTGATDYVLVGVADPDGDSLVEAATSSQGWAWLGHVQRDETIVIHCVAVSWNGDANMQTARNSVFNMLGQLTTAIQTDPSFGVSGVLFCQGLTHVAFHQLQDIKGAYAAIPFDVTIRSRIS